MGQNPSARLSQHSVAKPPPPSTAPRWSSSRGSELRQPPCRGCPRPCEARSRSRSRAPRPTARRRAAAGAGVARASVMASHAGRGASRAASITTAPATPGRGHSWGSWLTGSSSTSAVPVGVAVGGWPSRTSARAIAARAATRARTISPGFACQSVWANNARSASSSSPMSAVSASAAGGDVAGSVVGSSCSTRV